MRGALKYLIGSQCAAPSDEGIYHPATVQAVCVTEHGDELLRVRFNGTNVECEFSKDELIGQNLSDVCSKRLQPDQNVYVVVDGKETIGIIRSIEPSGDYNVAIEGRIVTINKSDIRLLKNSMNIRNRTQSDATAANRRLQNRLQNQSRSKDEFDVARTLANFSETAINFDSDRQSGSSEREKTLNQLSHDRRSVICENPGSIHTNQSVDMDEDMNEDTDDDIDVEAIDDPLADVDGVCDDNLMDTDQPEIIHRQNPDEDNKPKPHTVTQTLNLNQNVIHVIQMPVSTGQGPLPTTLQATPIQVVDSSGFYSSSPVIAMKNLQIGTPVGTPISNSPQPAFQANPIPIAMTPPVYNATIVHSPNTAPIAITTANREIYNRVALMDYGRPEYRLSPQFTTASPFSPNSPKMATSAPSGQPLRIGAQHTKVRGDGKKCRKIHGVNNRHLWCNACRWKKACVAFPD